jgi:spore coat protein CotH
LDGQYQGLYLLLEHIDDDFLDLESFDKNEDHNSLLYRAHNLNANFTAVNTHPQESPLFRHYAGSRQLGDKDRDPIFGWHSGFAQRHPEPERFGDYYQPLERFVRFAALSTDIRFQREIFNRLDMERYVDLWIFTQLLDDSDGLFQNRYLARRRGNGETWYFVPWDKDGVMGRGFDMTRRPHDQWLTTPLFQRCLQIPGFRTALSSRWDQLRKEGIISMESLVRAIDNIAALIASAQQRNFAKWPPDMPQYPDSATFSNEIEFMKEWLQRRIEWLDNRFGQLVSEGAPVKEEER